MKTPGFPQLYNTLLQNKLYHRCLLFQHNTGNLKYLTSSSEHPLMVCYVTKYYLFPMFAYSMLIQYERCVLSCQYRFNVATVCSFILPYDFIPFATFASMSLWCFRILFGVDFKNVFPFIDKFIRIHNLFLMMSRTMERSIFNIGTNICKQISILTNAYATLSIKSAWFQCVQTHLYLSLCGPFLTITLWKKQHVFSQKRTVLSPLSDILDTFLFR